MRGTHINADRLESGVHLHRDDVDAARHKVKFSGKPDAEITQLSAGKALHQHGLGIHGHAIRPVSIKTVQRQGIAIDAPVDGWQNAMHIGNVALHRQHAAIAQHDLALRHRQAATVAVVGHDHRGGFIIQRPEGCRQRQRTRHRSHIHINNRNVTIADCGVHPAGHRTARRQRVGQHRRIRHQTAKMQLVGADLQKEIAAQRIAQNHQVQRACRLLTDDPRCRDIACHQRAGVETATGTDIVKPQRGQPACQVTDIQRGTVNAQFLRARHPGRAGAAARHAGEKRQGRRCAHIGCGRVNIQLQVKVGKHHFKRGLRDQSCRCEYRAGCRDGQHRIGAVNHDIPGRDGDMQRRQAHLQPDISNGQ